LQEQDEKFKKGKTAVVTFLEDPQRMGKIREFWCLPSNYEILKLMDVGMFEKLREHDFPKIYHFESKAGSKMVPDLRKNS
jgi:hypothetical protein